MKNRFVIIVDAKEGIEFTEEDNNIMDRLGNDYDDTTYEGALELGTKCLEAIDNVESFNIIKKYLRGE